MPCLAGCHQPITLADRSIGLTHPQGSGSGHSGDSAVEIGLNLATNLETIELISDDIDSETGRQSGETESGLLVEVNSVDYVLVLGNIEEEVFGTCDALTSVESEEITDKAVELECRGLLLGSKGDKGKKNREGCDNSLCKREYLGEPEIAEDESYEADDNTDPGHVLCFDESCGCGNGIRRG